ncbi:uncharacterized protein LOC130547275 [Triplophysa rosa]|uniref:uncharacterized protein LOC130547275 n=1 Tax=Triplophysa rosa TaxID=992332 RepID=UPI0025461E3F|nr:uncharacterized protein LOC130547275 [Triplophysa rosa]
MLYIQISHTVCQAEFFFDNVSFIRDILDCGKLFDLDFGLISIDQEKAFDRIEHVYLWSALKAFGFSPDFISMIKVLYCGVESVLKINGDLCSPFRVYRGVRQGCALSGMSSSTPSSSGAPHSGGPPGGDREEETIAPSAAAAKRPSWEDLRGIEATIGPDPSHIAGKSDRDGSCPVSPSAGPLRGASAHLLSKKESFLSLWVTTAALTLCTTVNGKLDVASWRSAMSSINTSPQHSQSDSALSCAVARQEKQQSRSPPRGTSPGKESVLLAIEPPPRGTMKKIVP